MDGDKVRSDEMSLMRDFRVSDNRSAGMPWEIISEIRARINRDEMSRRHRTMIIHVNFIVLLFVASAIGFVAYRN